jgi:hypothetical protein
MRQLASPKVRGSQNDIGNENRHPPCHLHVIYDMKMRQSAAREWAGLAAS